MSLRTLPDHNLDPIQPAPKLPHRIIEPALSEFQENFNRAPFLFSHNLKEHSLFEIPRLVELSNMLHSKGHVFCRASDHSPDRKWDELPSKENTAEAISHIQESESFVMLSSTHLDSEYKALRDQALAELEELTSLPLHKEITWSIATIIIASPDAVTPYHFDHDCNFLFQIHGEKDVHLFNQYDRSVLTEEEIERYYLGDLSSADYREENQSKASTYHLVPGNGVHQPVRAPHWVRNGKDYSVSLSINFCLQNCDLQAKVYQCNYYLRKFGMRPSPPGRSGWQDKVKSSVVEMFSKRTPESHNELLFSGIDRMTAPYKWLAAQKTRWLKR
jgi:hypothetical protein